MRPTARFFTIVLPLALAACGEQSITGVPADSGTLAMSVGGLPAGANARITVNGNGEAYRVTASATVVLPAGTYTIVASDVPVGAAVFYPNASSQTVTVSA